MTQDDAGRWCITQLRPRKAQALHQTAATHRCSRLLSMHATPLGRATPGGAGEQWSRHICRPSSAASSCPTARRGLVARPIHSHIHGGRSHVKRSNFFTRSRRGASLPPRASSVDRRSPTAVERPSQPSEAA